MGVEAGSASGGKIAGRNGDCQQDAHGGQERRRVGGGSMLIQAGQTVCFMVSGVSAFWVQGHIFDRDLPSVRVGDRVDETNSSVPDVFHGVVSYVGAMVDTATSTTPVRVVSEGSVFLQFANSNR